MHYQLNTTWHRRRPGVYFKFWKMPTMQVNNSTIRSLKPYYICFPYFTNNVCTRLSQYCAFVHWTFSFNIDLRNVYWRFVMLEL